MVANQRVTGRAWSMPAGIGMGLLTCAGVTGAGCAAAAAMLDGGNLTIDGIGYAAMGILLAASFLGSVLAIRLCKARKLVVALMTGTVYYLSLLLVNGLIFGGDVSGAVVTALVILAGCVCGAMVPGGGDSGIGKKRRNMVKLYKNAGAGK